MKLIAGLGNPGKEYEKTRHNSGFLALDILLDQCGVTLNQKKWSAEIAITRINGEQVILMKPQTYMNESGRAVAEAYRFYQMRPEDVLILHDDMDLPVGSVRIRAKGSAGGQKGMKSVIQALGTEEIVRVRIGVGHSAGKDHDKVPDWVLSPVSKKDAPLFEESLKIAAEAAAAWLNQPLEKVMQYNRRPKAETEESK